MYFVVSGLHTVLNFTPSSCQNRPIYHMSMVLDRFSSVVVDFNQTSIITL